MTNARVAVAQMTSTADLEKNMQAVSALVHQAADERAKLLVLPESFAHLGPDNSRLKVAEPLPQGGPILAQCSAWARQAKMELVLGGFWEQANATQVYNTCVHLDADGSIKALYRKIHLFDVDLADGTSLQESATVVPGETPVVTQTCFGTLGLSVCYDVRFPELYRQLVDLGSIAMAIPAAFTLTTGKDHWHVLLRARAIESQAYVLAAAQTGCHYGNRFSFGHALICDPWGEVIAQCSEGQGIAVATLDPERVAAVREQLPSLKNRRLHSS